MSDGDGAGPAWLADFQARFSAMLRTPLDRSTGTLRAEPARYDPALRRAALPGRAASADERLAVYNRQYWFRLFGLFQSAFPLASRLLGYWSFNEHVSRFVCEHPPRSHLIDEATEGFAGFFARGLRGSATRRARAQWRVPMRAMLEAIQIDAAWRRVFYAPASAIFRPTAQDAQALLTRRLAPSPAVELVCEHWPLVELRRAHSADKSSASLALPRPLAAPQSWAFVRRPDGIGQLALAPLEARLFRLLRRHSVGEALARLEASCAQAERAALPGQAHGWLARSVELGFWVGIF